MAQYPDYQAELKDLYETGVTQRQIDAAKQKQKEQADLLMKQAAELAGPNKKKKETPYDALEALGKSAPKKYKKGGKVSSASSRADGCCIKGKTKGRMV